MTDSKEKQMENTIIDLISVYYNCCHLYCKWKQYIADNNYYLDNYYFFIVTLCILVCTVILK